MLISSCGVHMHTTLTLLTEADLLQLGAVPLQTVEAAFFGQGLLPIITNQLQ